MDAVAHSLHAYEGAVRDQTCGALRFFVLTLPFALYFAICESSRWQGTLGKRALGLRAVHVDGSRLSFGW